MAYTPPPGNAVNFDGTGAAYVPPAGNNIRFDGASSGIGSSGVGGYGPTGNVNVKTWRNIPKTNLKTWRTMPW